MNPSSTPDQTEKLAALQAYEAPPLKSEYDGFICEMALQHGAVMLNDEGSTYAFTQEQLLDFTKANRVPTQAVPVPFCWHWRRVGTGSSGVYYEHPEKFGMSLTDPAYEWTVLYDKPQNAAPILQAPAPVPDNTPPTEQPQEK